MGMLMRSTAPILQRLQPSLPVAPQPVIAGLARDVIDRTQLRRAVQSAFLLPQKPHPLVHHTARFPGHAALVHAPATAVSGMRPVQSVSHLPGLNHNLAQRGSAGEKDGAKRHTLRGCLSRLFLSCSRPPRYDPAPRAPTALF